MPSTTERPPPSEPASSKEKLNLYIFAPDSQEEPSPVFGLDTTRTLSFDSTFLTATPSDHAMAETGLALTDLVSLPFSLAREKTRFGASFVGGLMLDMGSLVPATFIMLPWIVTNHEMGHASRFRAFGYETLVFGVTTVVGDQIFDTTVSGPAEMFGYLLTHPSSLGAFVGLPLSETQREILANGGELPDMPVTREFAIISAGGVNQSVYAAEAIEERAATQGLPLAAYIPYLFAKIDTAQYASNEAIGLLGEDGGDLSHVLDYYRAQGTEVSLDTLGWSSWGSVALSGTSAAILTSIAKSGVGQSSSIRSLFIGPVRWPDFSFYLSSEGLSYKAKTAVRVNETLSVPVSAEAAFLDELEAFEAEIGVQAKLAFPGIVPELGASAKILAGTGGIGYDVRADYDYGPLTLGVGLTRYDPDTLFGERHAPDMTDDHPSYEAWARVSVNY